MFIGIDLGTSSLKVIVLDRDHQARASASVALTVAQPRRQWREQDPAHWWAACQQALQAALTQAGAARAWELPDQPRTIRTMKRAHSHLLRLFVTGALAALPLAATVAIFAWAASVLYRWLGPDSAVGSLLVAVGLGVTGSEVIGYLIGIGLVALALVVLGVLVEAGLQRGMARLLHSVMRRIPLVRQVYEMVQKMVALFYQRDPSAARAMRAVWLRFGGETGGAAVLALQTAPEVLMVEGRPCVAVLVPTAPVPVGGGLLFVPEHWVSPAALSVEAVTSLYVSMGVTAAQHLPVAAPEISRAPGA